MHSIDKLTHNFPIAFTNEEIATAVVDGRSSNGEAVARTSVFWLGISDSSAKRLDRTALCAPRSAGVSRFREVSSPRALRFGCVAAPILRQLAGSDTA